MRPTKKQASVLRCIRDEDPKILICSGAKRAGKTFVLNFAYLGLIAKHEGKGLSYILGGAEQASIRRNILNDWEIILRHDIKLDRANSFEIFGNRVYCFDGRNSDAWKRVRGFTAAGALLNEATALHDKFVKECISRCSYSGARIYMDTNPENPGHTVKKHYIDRDGDRLSNGRLNIKAFHFTLFDNDKLDPEYIESIVRSTPSGMFTDRDIYGRWVNAEGIVYRDFCDELYISEDDVKSLNYVRIIAGVDWGYEHFGSIVVIGITDDGTHIVLEEHAHQHEEIDFWVEIGKQIKAKYGHIPFYCDSARPEHVRRFRREGLKAINADKAVISGIEAVAKLIKTKKFRVIDTVQRFRDEISMYCWCERTGEPVKQMDDVLDSIRYAVYTAAKRTIRTMDKGSLGL